MPDETKKITLTKIWSFIKSKMFIVLVIAGLIAINAMQCSRIQELKRQQKIDEQNQAALTDTIKIERQKNGELQASIAVFVSDIKDLKSLNEDLWKRVKDQNGKILDLNHVIIVLRQDSATLAKSLDQKNKIIEKLLKIDDNTYIAGWTLPFKYDSTNFEVVKGKTYIAVTNKDPLELAHVDTELIDKLTQIDLTFGHKEEKGMIRVYVQSGFPGFTVKSLEGVLIDPNQYSKLAKKKHWFQGFGIGPEVTMGFNVTTGKYGLVLGAGIHYTIYRF
jgi:predicted RND superfamily exporter protein